MLSNIRFYVLVFGSLLAGGIYFYARSLPLGPEEQIFIITQYYALTAITFLYFTLLASPLTRFFTFLPYRGQYLKARRALGVSAFFFGLLHAYHGFFWELGGFGGLKFLTPDYIIAITLSTTSLIILSLMAATANEAMIEKLTFPTWKMLHKFVYLVALFTAIHALLIGTHFANLSEAIPKIFITALTFLLILESLRLDLYLGPKLYLPKNIVGGVLIALILASFGYYLLSS